MSPELVSVEDEDRPAAPPLQPQQALPGASTLDQLEPAGSIAQAPRVVAKSTGYHPSPRQGAENQAPPRLSQVLR